MSEFKVGEIAIYVRPGSPYYGQEVEILSELLFVHLNGKDTVTRENLDFWAHRHQITNITGRNSRLWAPPEWLKKKKPPARDIDKKVSWNDCIWKPAGVVA